MAFHITLQLEYYAMSIHCAIGLVNDSNKRFYLNMQQNDPFLEKGNNGIGIITPKLIAQAIRFVNTNTDWKNSKKTIAVEFFDNELRL